MTAAYGTADGSARAEGNARDTGAPPQAHRYEDVLAALDGDIAPVRRSLAYRLTLLPLAAVMVLLPLTYVALVTMLGFGIYYHAVHGLGLFGGRSYGYYGLKLRAFLYATPIVLGVVVLLFMLKPLFARRRSDHSGLLLRREDQPLLFDYVDKLAEIVRAPAPEEIKVDTAVNASASFRRGWWSLIAGDLRLTIGLPLVAGMPLRELTGVLAHELGHFTQSLAMRLEFVVNSINQWFASVVYERDEWDEWLENTQHGNEGWISLAAMLTAGVVWLTRRVLWLLMMIGHAVSCLQSRRMEFDADRYEARVAGSEVFAETVRRLHLLGWAQSQALGEARAGFQAARLPDDLPNFIRNIAERSPAELNRLVEKQIAAARTGWFSTHPADSERIANAEREDTPGIVTIDAPARVLFRGFDQISKTLTFIFYRDVIGEGVEAKHLVPVADAVQSATQRNAEARAAEQYLGFAWTGSRLLRLEPFEPSPPNRASAAVERIHALAELMEASADALPPALADRDLAISRLDDVAQVRALLKTKTTFNINEFGMADRSAAAPDKAERAARDLLQSAEHRIGEFEDLLQERVTLALGLLAMPKIAAKLPDAADRIAQADRHLRVASSIRGALRDESSLRTTLSVLELFLVHGARPGDASLLQTVLNTNFERLGQFLRETRTLLEHTPYPFAHADGQVTVARFLCRDLPRLDDPATLYRLSLDFLTRLHDLHERCIHCVLHRVSDFERMLRPKPAAATSSSAKPEEGDANSSSASS